MTTLEEGPEVQAMWCSFLPALTRALLKSTGPILEIGVGHFSTPFLHEWSEATGRELVSVESSFGWAEKFRERCSSESHEFIVDAYDEVLPKLAREPWGVVFIDGSPGGKARGDQLRMFMPVSDFVVVHDYHDENEDAIQPIVDAASYKWLVYFYHFPPTLLAWK